MVREASRIATPGQRRPGAATLPSHTAGHIAYARGARSGEQSGAVGATLLDSLRGERCRVRAAPRSWKNDFR